MEERKERKSKKLGKMLSRSHRNLLWAWAAGAGWSVGITGSESVESQLARAVSCHSRSVIPMMEGEN